MVKEILEYSLKKEWGIPGLPGKQWSSSIPGNNICGNIHMIAISYVGVGGENKLDLCRGSA